MSDADHTDVPVSVVTADGRTGICVNQFWGTWNETVDLTGGVQDGDQVLDIIKLGDSMCRAKGSTIKCIVIPDTVFYLDNYCLNTVKGVVYDFSKAEYLVEGACAQATFSNKVIRLTNKKMTDVPKSAFSWCQSIKCVEMPNVTNIGNSAFSDTSGITNVVFSKEAVRFGSQTFHNGPLAGAHFWFPGKAPILDNTAFQAGARRRTWHCAYNADPAGWDALAAITPMTEAETNSCPPGCFGVYNSNGWEVRDWLVAYDSHIDDAPTVASVTVTERDFEEVALAVSVSTFGYGYDGATSNETGRLVCRLYASNDVSRAHVLATVETDLLSPGSVPVSFTGLESGVDYTVVATLYAGGRDSDSVEKSFTTKILPVAYHWYKFSDGALKADSAGSGISMTGGGTARSVGGVMRQEYGAAGFDASGHGGYAVNNISIEFFWRPLCSYQWGARNDTGHYSFFSHSTGKSYGTMGSSNTYNFFAQYGYDSASAVYNKVVFAQDPFTFGRWHHVVYAVDCTQTTNKVLTLYIDGVKQETVASAKAAAGEAPPKFSSIRPLTNISRTYGDLDDYRVIKKTLTPDDFMNVPTVDVATEPPAGAKTCSKAYGDQAWSAASTWGGAVPVAGDTVFIRAGKNVVVESSTPRLAKLIVEGSLICRGWGTKIQADEIVVQNTGVITTEGGFTTDEAKNRVWLVCDDLFVEKNGMIEVGECGWADGYGEGCGTVSGFYTASPSHGGRASLAPSAPDTVGSLEYPENPGAGGFKNANQRGGWGGGAVRIDAMKRVTVDGVIRADGGSVQQDNHYVTSGGAGGSILINCETFAGTDGLLSANGHYASGCATGAGGGRIAVHYDTTKQTADLVHHVVFSAEGGHQGEWPSGQQYGTDRPAGYREIVSALHHQAQAGTLWLPDAKLITADSLGDFSVRLCPSINELTFEGDVTVTHWLGFMADGMKLTVNGNLTISGAGGRIDFGVGDTLGSHANLLRKWYENTVPSRLRVKGSLAVLNGARMDVYAARTGNPETIPGAKLDIGGAFTVDGASYVYLTSAPTNGASVAVDVVGDFYLGTNSVISADSRGFAEGKKVAVCGYGPGGSKDGTGPSYGGLGGYSTAANLGPTYGRDWYPLLPGSGGSCSSDNVTAGPGGGRIAIRVGKYATLYGTLTANGGGTGVWVNYCTAGTGTGGSIVLEVQKGVVSSDTAVMSAKSGSADYDNRSTCFSGGGGRIVLWQGKPYSARTKRQAIEVTEGLPPEVFAGTVTADAGFGAPKATENRNGQPGTIRYVMSKSYGTLIMLR